MILVDASVWIDYFRGTPTPEAAWLDANLDARRLGVADLTLCEVLQGVRGERTAATVRRRLCELDVFSRAFIPVDRSLVLAFLLQATL